MRLQGVAVLVSVLAPALGLAQGSTGGIPTVVEHEGAREKLVGEHVFNLQWIDNPPGRATVEERRPGELHLRAEQRNKRGDYATVNGRILRITEKTFELEGEVVTRVYHLAKGEPCARAGLFTFRITGKRKYWRLKQMDNVCEGQNTVDYVDVFFERPRPPSEASSEVPAQEPARRR